MFLTRKGNSEVLAYFLSRILNIPRKELVKIEILNPILDKEDEKDRQFIVDILIKTKSGKIIHVEMQTLYHKGFEGRIVAYNGREFSSQLRVSQQYTKLNAVYSIIITDFVLFPETETYHDVFMYRGEKGNILTDLTQIHVIELPKLPDIAETEKELWLKLFKAREEAELDMLAEKLPEIKQAVMKIRELSADEEAQQRERERVSSISITKTFYEDGMEKGMRKGMKKGMRKGIEIGREEVMRNNTRNMLGEGFSVEVIAKILNMPISWVEEQIK